MKDMKIGLNIGERIVLGSVLPREGNFLTLRLVRDLSSKIGITADEHKKYEIIEDKETHGIKWNAEGLKEIDFDFKLKEVELISKVLTELDKTEKLDLQHYSIYDKFVAEDEEVDTNGKTTKTPGRE